MMTNMSSTETIVFAYAFTLGIENTAREVQAEVKSSENDV